MRSRRDGKQLIRLALRVEEAIRIAGDCKPASPAVLRMWHRPPTRGALGKFIHSEAARRLFLAMVHKGLGAYTIEALVVEFSEMFPESTVRIASYRLAQFGLLQRAD